MTAKDIKSRINSLCTHFIFTYNGKNCGVDPFSRNRFEMWCENDDMIAKSIDEVMETPFFDGKKLSEIVEKIVVESW